MSLVRAGRLLTMVLTAAIAVALAGVTPSAAPGAARSDSDVEQLWREYPLEQTPTTEGAAARPRTDAAPSAPHDRPSASTGAGTIVLLAAAGLLLLVAALSLVSSRRKRHRAPPSEQPLPAEPAEAPQPRFERDAGRAAPAVAQGPVCQIRWSAHGRRSCFIAFVRGADGTEQRVARSPRVVQLGASPPKETPEAKAALRKLAKELRDDGWKPLRAKGKDYGERQWYTRRFRRVVELASTEEPEGSRGVGSW